MQSRTAAIFALLALCIGLVSIAAPSTLAQPVPAVAQQDATATATTDETTTPSTSINIPVAEPAAKDWTTYGGNMYNQRFSSLNQINTDNVANLKGAWTYKTGAVNPGTSFEASPIVVDGTMYITGPQSQVYALNAKTGEELWKWDPELKAIEALPLCCGQVNRGVTVGDGKVFVAQLDAKLTALDAATGEVAWSVQIDEPRAGYTETMAPLYHDGLVYVGSSGAEYEIRGHVTAYNAASGEQAWRFYTIPEPGQLGFETWPQDTDMWKYGGGSMWQTPALDPELGLLYIMVGNPSPDLDGSIRQGDNLFTESIVALDIKTGQHKWHFQQIHHDIWDYDAVSPTFLFDTEINGQAVKGVGQAGKTGWVYLLDRATGEPLVPIDEKEVPQNEWQKTAKTQPFPQGDPFVPLECPEKIDDYPMGGIFTPFGKDDPPILICPGANGGSEWSPVSYNPQTNYTYVCGIHQPQIWTAKPEKIEQGTLRLGSSFFTPPGGRTWGTFTAIDVRTNKIAWQKDGSKGDDFKQMCIGGSMTTAGGLVFIGEGNGNFNAYNAQSGDRLWQFQTGAGVNAPPVTYEIDGEQFIAVASGGNFQLNFPRGDTLWVFSLNGTLGPAEAPPEPEAAVGAEGGGTATNVAKVIDFGYAPGLAYVPPGTTITWTNDGPTVHTVTSDNKDFDSGIMQQGDTFSFTFDKPGTYRYFCIPHPFMRARVLVDEAAPEPVATEQPAGLPAAQEPVLGSTVVAPSGNANTQPTSTPVPTAATSPGASAAASPAGGAAGGAAGTPGETTRDGGGGMGWIPIAVIGLAALGGLGFFLMRRRPS